MDSWTKRSHYPLVKVEEWKKPNAGKLEIKVNQTTFLLNADVATTDETLWQVPIKAVVWDEKGERGCGCFCARVYVS